MLTLKCMFIHRVNKVQNVPKDRKDLCSITTGKLLYLDKLSSVTLLRERGVLKEMPSCSLTSTFPVLETQNEPTFHQKKKNPLPSQEMKWSIQGWRVAATGGDISSPVRKPENSHFLFCQVPFSFHSGHGCKTSELWAIYQTPSRHPFQSIIYILLQHLLII